MIAITIMDPLFPCAPVEDEPEEEDEEPEEEDFVNSVAAPNPFLTTVDARRAISILLHTFIFV
jgi:hypothetical protein